jgi:hypothetical protein
MLNTIPRNNPRCRNPNLGFTTKARAYKVEGQERKLMSEKKCEGVNPHIPKGASTLGVGVLNVQRMITRVKTQAPKFLVKLKCEPKVKIV